MRNPISAMEQALNKKSNFPPMPQNMPAQGREQNRMPQNGMQQNAMQQNGMPQGMQSAPMPADFNDVVNELGQLVLEGKLPPDFDLQQACMDKEFANLIAEFPAEAALRIYYAEGKAANAEQSAMQRVNQQVQSRRALPRSARAGAMSAPAPNYRDMDDETFRKLLADMKKSARNGNAPRL